MIYIQINTKSGNIVYTGFNGTLQEAQNYYKGQSLVTEDDITGKETIDPYTTVALITK